MITTLLCLGALILGGWGGFKIGWAASQAATSVGIMKVFEELPQEAQQHFADVLDKLNSK